MIMRAKNAPVLQRSLVSKGANESLKSMNDQLPKGRLKVFKRREQLRKKIENAKSKLSRGLLFSRRKAATAADAPVVQRSRLVRAAAANKVTEIDHLLSKDKRVCVPDEFEVN